MLWAAACIGFFRFLRCAEFTAPSVKQFNPETHLCLRDISAHRVDGRVQTVALHLKVSKTDQFGKGVDIFLERTGAPLCPV
jgi:hypothetical protein